jgi:hypothetical protein
MAAPLLSPRAKPCENVACTNLIEEQPGHGGKEFEGRRFCSHACSIAVRRKTLLIAKPCTRAGCDQLIHPREDERPNKFAVRKFCSTECQRLAFAGRMAGGWLPGEAAERRRKPCKRCSQQVVQYPNEGAKKWESRQYCCKACSRLARQESNRASKAPPGTRRKGNMQPRETRFVSAYSSAKIEAAVNRLRRTRAVFPAAVVHRPNQEPAGEHHLWVVGTRQMTTEELLAEAAKAMKSEIALPTADEIGGRLTYDAATGVFSWAKRGRGCRLRPNAGYLDPNGYVTIRVFGRLYRAHRLAFLLVNREWPRDQIDHVNGNRSDNRWSNLRLATHTENTRNSSRHQDGSSRFKGVYYDTDQGRWVAQIRRGGKTTFLGRFVAEEDAAAAYDLAAQKEHGEFARLNLRAATAAVVAFWFLLSASNSWAHEWYSGLKQPDGRSCCNGFDCAATQMCVQDGREGVMVKGAANALAGRAAPRVPRAGR